MKNAKLSLKQKSVILCAVVAVLGIAAVIIVTSVLCHLDTRLPKADQSDIGQTVTLSFLDLLAGEQYDEGNRPANYPEEFIFAYVYHAETNTGRLATFQRVSDAPSLCCVTVYAPEWAGGEGLCNALREPFQAEVVARVNITKKEGLHLMANAAHYYGQFPQSLLVDVENYSEASIPYTQYFLAKMEMENPLAYSENPKYWHMLNAETGITIKTGTYETAIEEIRTSIGVLIKIVDHYDLYDVFQIDRDSVR